MAKQKKPRGAGKNAGRIKTYYESGRLLQKKLRNVIQASGFNEGQRWAKRNGCEGILASFVNSNPPLRWLERAKARDQERGLLEELRVSATPEQKLSARQVLATT